MENEITKVRENEFSKDKINEFVFKLLGDRKKITTAEISINNEEDFFKLVLIQIYSQYEEMIYKIEYKDDIQSIYGYHMQSFDIIRKEIL